MSMADMVTWCCLPSEKEGSKVKRHAVDLGVEPRFTGVKVCMSPSLCSGAAPPPTEGGQQRGQTGPCSRLSWPATF